MVITNSPDVCCNAMRLHPSCIIRMRYSLTLFVCSSWSSVETRPPDAIFGLVEAHKKDPRPNKVSLAIGAYRDKKGDPLVLPTVRKADQCL